MKKLLCLFLTLAILFSLSGCRTDVTEKDKENVGGKVDSSTSETTEDEKWSSGNTTANVYTSEFAGFKITSPGGTWEFKDEKTILELMNITVNEGDILTEEQKEAAVAAKNTIYDAMLSDAATGSNIIVMYENLSVTNSLLMSENQYCEILKNQLTATNSYTVGAATTTEVAGNKYSKLEASATVNGVSVNQCYLIRKIGRYMLAICITPGAGSSNTVDSMIAMISEN